MPLPHPSMSIICRENARLRQLPFWAQLGVDSRRQADMATAALRAATATPTSIGEPRRATAKNAETCSRSNRCMARSGLTSRALGQDSWVPAWAAVAITLGASFIAVMGTLAATRIQLRHSRRALEDAERARWRERGAEVVAPLKSLIDDAEPLRLGLAQEEWKERWDGLWERWALLRHELTIFAAAHPSPEIGKTVTEITMAVPMALADAGWFLGSFVGRQVRAHGFSEAQAGAQSSHQRAMELADELFEEIRAFGSGGVSATPSPQGRRPVLTVRRRGRDIFRVWGRSK